MIHLLEESLSVYGDILASAKSHNSEGSDALFDSDLKVPETELIKRFRHGGAGAQNRGSLNLIFQNFYGSEDGMGIICTVQQAAERIGDSYQSPYAKLEMRSGSLPPREGKDKGKGVLVLKDKSTAFRPNKVSPSRTSDPSGSCVRLGDDETGQVIGLVNKDPYLSQSGSKQEHMNGGLEGTELAGGPLNIDPTQKVTKKKKFNTGPLIHDFIGNIAITRRRSWLLCTLVQGFVVWSKKEKFRIKVGLCSE